MSRCESILSSAPERGRKFGQGALRRSDVQSILQNLVIHRCFPSRDHDRRERVAENVDRNKGRGQETMHAEDQPNGGNRDSSGGSERGYEDHYRGSGHAGAALGRHQQNAQ